MPEEVYLITTGECADQHVLAVATDPDLAQRWADRWTLGQLDTIAVGYGEKAVVGGRVPFIHGGAS